jgi:SAM-dependent methyltransferase
MKNIIKLLLKYIPRPLLIRLSYIFRVFTPVLYRGNNVECPVCEKHFSKFLPYGYVTQRENVLCPYDLTLERHRLMWYYLKNESDFFIRPNIDVLHIAPEQCFYKLFRNQKNLNYLTGDLESPLADLHFDLHNIPLENNKFDVIFCNHVLEHVEDAKKCMSELYRVMKPGGFGIFQVPQDFNRDTTYENPNIITPEEREKHFWQYDHVRLFGLDYPDWLRSVGFNIEEFNPEKKIDSYQFERFRLMKNEILYIAYKN